MALKVIKAGMDTKQVIARFESERQALAVMDHPAIAKVFDGGSTPEGRPFFVMEYVPGVSITEHCDTHRLPTEERLRLFIEVCEGVQHAHQKAIIHRDLKPSNILVSLVDGQAQPRIIDFGIAKATSQRLTEKTLFTEAGALLGTPEYMSPEQADFTNQDIDTRTDVYSLGVILYELLTGELPFGSKELRSSSYEELRRKLKEVEPPRPSTKLSTFGGEAEEAARNRATEPGALRRQLEGDLDAITMKALEKVPARRYGTPSDLATDIARHLRHEPVVARPPSSAYRIAKYVQRHRLGVSVAAGAMILLFGFTATTYVQARRIARERDRASLEAASAEGVTEFLIKLFQVSNPTEAKGKAVTAKELLDKAVGNISTLKADPRLETRLLGTMGEVYSNLYQLAPASETLQKAEALSLRTYGAASPVTLGIQARLGKVRIYLGDYAVAESTLRAVLGHIDAPPGTRDPVLAKARNLLVTCLMRRDVSEKPRRPRSDFFLSSARPSGPNTSWC